MIFPYVTTTGQAPPCQDINIPIRSSDPTSMPTGLISRIVMSGYSNIVIGNINDSWDGQKITVYTDRLGKGSTYVYGEKI